METRLFFNRFPLDTTEEDIRDLFSQYGKVVKIVMFTDRETGEPRGRGYVTLHSYEAAQTAIEALNDVEIEGQLIRVKLDEKMQQNPAYILQSNVEEIARLLGETEYVPMKTIKNTLVVKGLEFAQELLADTFRIEEQGGMLVPDGSRRRTPGGVFFALLRERINPEEYLRIYPHKTPKKPPSDLPSGEA